MKIDLLRTDERVFLVKASDEILGPFTRDELKEKISSKEIGILDEVNTPLSSWRFIREEPVFAKVVEEIRKGQMLAHEDTEIGNTNTAIQIAVPSSKTDSRSTPEISQPVLTPPEAPEIRDFGVKPSESDRAEIRRSLRPIWLVAILAFCLAVIFALRMQDADIVQPNTGDYAGLFDEANAIYDLGLWDQALDRYSTIRPMNLKDKEVAIRYAMLLLRLGKSRLEAMRIFEEIASQTKSTHLMARALNGQGLAFGIDGDFKSALEKFSEAAQLEPEVEIYKLNVAATNLKLEDGSQRFAQVIDYYNDLSEFIMNRDKGSKSKILNGSEQVQTYFAQEILLWAIRRELSGESFDLAKMNGYLLRYVQSDPFLSQEYWIDPALFVPFKSSEVATTCEEIYDRLEKKKSLVGRANLFLAVCKAQTENKDTALKLLNLESQKNTNLNVIRALQSYVLWDSGFDDAQVRASLHLAAEGGKSRLSRILQARFCLKSADYKCVAQTLSEIAENDAYNSDWISFAKIRMQINEQGKVSDEDLQALLKSKTNYLPIKRLQGELRN